MPAPYETHRAQLKAILAAWGMPEDNAEWTADVLGWADLHGVDSHGISMLPGYDRLRRTGRANMAARPHIIKETPVSALVDGDGGLGHVPARFAMQVAIDKANEAGMRGQRDEAHLAYAAESGRVLCSFNRSDFYRIHTEYLTEGRSHAGLILRSSLLLITDYEMCVKQKLHRN